MAKLVAEDCKAGKWKDVGGDMCICTSCGWGFLFPYNSREKGSELVHSFNFCPECGAKMSACFNCSDTSR